MNHSNNIIEQGQQDLIVEKGARWFLKQGENTLSVDKGFKSKSDASEWVDSLGRSLDWRAGYVFRLRGSREDLKIVNRVGNLART